MSEATSKPVPKPLIWIGSSKEDLIAFPGPARREAGYALFLAQIGRKAIKAKPMKGFGGAGVLEVITDHDGNTYRTVYSVRFAEVVFVLHAFQKKSKKGSATPKSDLDLIKRRLKIAVQEYERLYRNDNP
jgi:phage-related protein